MAAIEAADAAIRVVATGRSAKVDREIRRSDGATMTAESVTAEKHDVDRQDDRADADAERFASRGSANHIAFQTS